MKKILLTDPIAPIAEGLNKIAPLILSSFGPDKGIVLCGGKVVNMYSGLLAHVKHDNNFENIAVKLIEDLGRDVYAQAGSGMNLATLLAVSLVGASRKLLTAGYSNRQIHDWLSCIEHDFELHLDAETAETVLEVLENKCGRSEEWVLQAVATTAVQDAVMGKAIGTMCHKIGRHAHIDIIRDDIPEIRVEYKNGFTFNTSPLSYHFLKGKRKELVNPKILTTDGTLDDVRAVADCMIAANKEEVPLLILANGLSAPVLTLLLHNLNIGALEIVAVKTPEFNFGQHEALIDIRQITGATPVSTAQQQAPTPAHLGTSPRVIVEQTACTLYFSQPVPESYIKAVEKRAEKVKSSTLKAHVNARISNLRGQAAVIKVGGYTDRDRETGYYRVEAAIHATRGAQTDGYIAGGYQIFNRFGGMNARHGIPDTLYDAMGAPLRALMLNYHGDAPLADRTTRSISHLFDTKQGKMVSMWESGIVDSTKSIQVAVAAAISLARTLVLTGAIVVEVE
jgi:chaperonin GroEL (HSP60 family)